MPLHGFRVVVDTNVLLRAFTSPQSRSAQILDACERRILITLLSKPVLDEYRVTLTHPKIAARYPQVEPSKVHIAIERLRYIGETVRNPGRPFNFPRDPKDAKLLELAIAGNATHLITADPDLLDLTSGHDARALRLRRTRPNLQIVLPAAFWGSFDHVAH